MEIKEWIELSKWLIGAYLAVGVLSGILAVGLVNFGRRYGDLFLSRENHEAMQNANRREIFCLAVVVWPGFLASIIAGGINGMRNGGS